MELIPMGLRLFIVGLDRGLARGVAASWVRQHLQPSRRPSELALRSRCETDIGRYIGQAAWENVCRGAGYRIIDHQICARLRDRG